MVAFIDAHRGQEGTEPICAQLPIAPTTYYHHKAREKDATKVPAGHLRDQSVRPHIQRVWEENLQVYGARKVWLQLNREGFAVARRPNSRIRRSTVQRATAKPSRFNCNHTLRAP